MFRGTFEQKIDEKGRVNVPVKYRDALRGEEDDRVFITNFRVGPVRCLEVSPYAVWLRLEQWLRERPPLTAEAIRFYHNFYIPGAQECQIDKQGRLLVPPRLRGFAGLMKDVVFTGALDRFRIWDIDAWLPVFEGGEQILVDNPDILSEIGV